MASSASSNSNCQLTLVIGFDPNLLSEKSRNLINIGLDPFNIKVEFLSINLNFEMHINDYLSPATYGRLLIADKLSDNFLWLDADILCLKDWDEVFSSISESDEYLLQGCLDPLVRKEFIVEDYYNNAAILRSNGLYINAGVLYFNTSKWQKLNLNELWPKLASNYDSMDFDFHDQCILNYMAAVDKKILPDEYDYIVSKENLRPIEPVRIAHFAGFFKPWNSPLLALWIFAPKENRDLYRKYVIAQLHFLQKIFFNDRRNFMKFIRLFIAARRYENVRIILKKKIYYKSFSFYKSIRNLFQP
jgi:lipopolysaccharide biosynthesis glycosyltransferase